MKVPKSALAVDVGNTHTVLGFFAGGQLRHLWRIPSRSGATADELLGVLEPLLRDHLPSLGRGRRIVLGSVVPSLTEEMTVALERLTGARVLQLTHRLRTGVRLAVREPASVGADRIANAVEAAHRGRLPAIVVDLGTATTFDVVDRRRAYRGGVIAPGILTSAETLFRRAARLSKVEIRRPRRVVGRTTEASLQSGLFYGAVAQIDGLVGRIQKELGQRCHVLATGGLAHLIAPASSTIREVDPGLTLKGLHRVLALNT
jgi:type III pantothenate kinase